MFLRRKRVWIPALVAVLVVAAAVAGNQLVRSTAESRISKALACGLKSAKPATAHLQDRWAALGVLDGDLGTVRARADQVQLGGTPVRLEATLKHVTTGGRTSGGSASATVAYEQVAKRRGGDLHLRGDGRNLVIDTTFGVPVTVYATLAAAPRAVTVTPTQVSTLGEKYSISQLAGSPFGKLLPKNQLSPRTIALPDLPAGTALTAATPAADGLRLALSISADIAAPACTR